MANQSRNEMDRTNETTPNGSATGSSTQQWGSTAQQGAQASGMRDDRTREEFYRRAERGRGGYGQQEYGGERGGRYTQGGTYTGGYGNEGYNRGGMYNSGSYGGEGYNRGGYGAGMGAGGMYGGGMQGGTGYEGGGQRTGGMYGNEGYNRGGMMPGRYGQETYERSAMWAQQGSGNEAYGDYGHPGEEGRYAYGDMGAGHTPFQQHQGPSQPGMFRGGEQHRGEQQQQHRGGGLMDRLMGRSRRWRRGNQCARDVMTRSPRTARPTDTVQQIAQIMVDEDTGIVPIVGDDNRLLGVVTDRDIVCRLIARGVDMKNARATDVMTDDVECVTEQETLNDVLRLMSEHQIRRIPVVARNDRLVGIISMADIAREADVDEQLQDTFEEISSERGFWARLR